ncbi:hypothetical protein BC835DRAFT_1309950 [Cytidiella melzeri]|nr:hypothetical protein BC835DRAFT_1309950 [Cytidiella melzeri]
MYMYEGGQVTDGTAFLPSALRLPHYRIAYHRVEGESWAWRIVVALVLGSMRGPGVDVRKVKWYERCDGVWFTDHEVFRVDVMPNPVPLRPPLYFHASLTAFVSCSLRTISKHRAPPRVLFTCTSKRRVFYLSLHSLFLILPLIFPYYHPMVHRQALPKIGPFRVDTISLPIIYSYTAFLPMHQASSRATVITEHLEVFTMCFVMLQSAPNLSGMIQVFLQGEFPRETSMLREESEVVMIWFAYARSSGVLIDGATSFCACLLLKEANVNHGSACASSVYRTYIHPSRREEPGRVTQTKGMSNNKCNGETNGKTRCTDDQAILFKVHSSSSNAEPSTILSRTQWKTTVIQWQEETAPR